MTSTTDAGIGSTMTVTAEPSIILTPTFHS